MKYEKFAAIAGVLAVGLVGTAWADERGQNPSTLLDPWKSFTPDANSSGKAYGHKKHERDADLYGRDYDHGRPELPFASPVPIAIKGDHKAGNGHHRRKTKGNPREGQQVGVTGPVVNGPAPSPVPDQGGTVTLLLLAGCGLLATRRRIVSQT